MIPYIIAGVIGYGIAKLLEKDDNKEYAEGGGVGSEMYMLLYDFVDEKMIEGDSVAESMINEKGYSLTYDELYDYVDEKMIEGDSDAENLLNRINSFKNGGGVDNNKWKYLYFVQGSYGQGFEDLTAHENREDAKAEMRVYDDNETYPHRVILRKVLTSDYEKGNYARGGGVGKPSKKEMLDYLNMYFDNYSELRTIAIEEDNILTRRMLNSLDNEELEMAYDDAKYEIKAETQFAKGGVTGKDNRAKKVIRNVNGFEKEFPIGDAWRKEHNQYNESEKYEISKSSRKS